MGQQNKTNLKSFFQTGFKPTQQNFADLIDSYPNKDDDGISIDSKNVTLTNGITIGNSTLNTAGTIRWNGTTFQFRDSTGWKDLNSGGGSSQWTTVGSDINLLTGNVGIGLPAATAPTYKFEVNLGTGSTTADKVRFGDANIFSRVNTAYFSHKDKSNINDFALAQDLNGDTVINYPTGRKILFTENKNTSVMIISDKTVYIPSVPGSPPSDAAFYVAGKAYKTTGAAWDLTSDKRLKTDMFPFNDGLTELKKLDPIKFRYNGKSGIATSEELVGLIAQEVLKVFPYMVGKYKAKLEEKDSEETELLTFNPSALTFVMINAIKELDEKLTRLEKRNKQVSSSKHL